MFCFSAALEFTVVTFFKGIIEIGGGMNLAIVFNFFITLDLNNGVIVESEAVGCVNQILFLNQYTLKGLGIEAKGGATL
jgi:hypothetical protein